MDDDRLFVVSDDLDRKETLGNRLRGFFISRNLDLRFWRGLPSLRSGGYTNLKVLKCRSRIALTLFGRTAGSPKVSKNAPVLCFRKVLGFLAPSTMEASFPVAATKKPQLASRAGAFLLLRFRADSNRCSWFCRPVPSHSATEP